MIDHPFASAATWRVRVAGCDVDVGAGGELRQEASTGRSDCSAFRRSKLSPVLPVFALSWRPGAASSGKWPVNLIAFGTLCSVALFLGVHWGVSRGAAEEPEQHAQLLMRTVTQLSAGMPARAASVLAQSEAAEAASVDARHAFGALKVRTVRNVD